MAANIIDLNTYRRPSVRVERMPDPLRPNRTGYRITGTRECDVADRRRRRQLHAPPVHRARLLPRPRRNHHHQEGAVMQSEAIDELAAALSKAQAVMTAAQKNKKNPHFKSDYADLASIIDAVRKPLTDNGLAFTQTIYSGEMGLFLETLLLHTSGHWLRSEYPLVQGTPQQTGSSLTYARRYSLSSIAGIAADEDDDGAAATNAGQRPQQRKQEVTPLKAGEIAPHAFAIPRLPDGGDDWRSYAVELVTVIRASGEQSAWLEANKHALATMRKAAPDQHKNLLAAIHESAGEPE
jgi:hypothetical protein